MRINIGQAELLRVQRTLVGRYWHDAAIQVDDFRTKASSLPAPGPIVNTPVAAKQPIASTIPEEGATGYRHYDDGGRPANPNCLCGWCIPVAESAGRRLGLVRLLPVARRLQGVRTVDRRRLQDLGYDNFDKIVWKTPVAEMRHPERSMRALLPRGRIYRRHRRR